MSVIVGEYSVFQVAVYKFEREVAYIWNILVRYVFFWNSNSNCRYATFLPLIPLALAICLFPFSFQSFFFFFSVFSFLNTWYIQVASHPLDFSGIHRYSSPYTGIRPFPSTLWAFKESVYALAKVYLYFCFCFSLSLAKVVKPSISE